MIAAPFESYLVYALHPLEDRVDARLTGKYLTHDGVVHVVSDHDGVLEGLDGARISSAENRLSMLRNGYHYTTVKKDIFPPEPQEPQDDELAWEREVFGNGGEETQVDPPASSDGHFKYQREGHDTPRSIEIRGGQVLVDGQPLPEDEVGSMVDNVRRGVATLQRVVPPNFAKSATEAYISMGVLQKGDLNHSFEALRALVGAGHLHQDHYDALRRELYQDEMIPGLGNKRAFRDFVKNPGHQGGVHVMLDGNGMKSINDTHGHEAGDHAIVAMGQALRSAIDSVPNANTVKAHRFGGDEFHFYAPDAAHAQVILRRFREHLDAMPPIKGTHKLGMSAGMGADPVQADSALYTAKEASRGKGMSLTAHSLHPTAPGPVDVNNAPAPPAAAPPPKGTP